MNDRAPIRDRTLVLRVLVPGLEARLRDKMRDMEETAASSSSSTTDGKQSQSQQSQRDSAMISSSSSTPTNSGGGGGGGGTKDMYLDLEGVTCEPTSARGGTLWNFHCDGATYPARLVNLPCPVELHKTHDHLFYYKSVDLAQMLIVYEDDMALEEAEEKPEEGFPSYYHSGLTPPMRRVVERRFAAREQKTVPPPRVAVGYVESELMDLMDKLSKEEKTKRNKVPTLTSANKVLEEVVEEIVDYEPWMSDYGRQPHGVEFDADDQLCSLHPDVWLSPDVIRELKGQDQKERRKKQEAAEKEEAKRKEKKQNEQPHHHIKKGIPAKKKVDDIVDEVTQAATSMLASAEYDLVGGVLEDDDFFGGFDLDDEDIDFVNL